MRSKKPAAKPKRKCGWMCRCRYLMSDRSKICKKCGRTRAVVAKFALDAFAKLAKQFGDLPTSVMATSAPAKREGVDGQYYNCGRAEGRADVCAELRAILDVDDKHHWNKDGLLKEVARLVGETPATLPRVVWRGWGCVRVGVKNAKNYLIWLSSEKEATDWAKSHAGHVAVLLVATEVKP